MKSNVPVGNVIDLAALETKAILLKVQGLPQSEIAKKMNLRISSVKKILDNVSRKFANTAEEGTK